MEQQATEFTIRPNASYPCRSWPWFLGVLVLVSMIIALRLAWLGFWMVLPFTLLELGFLVVMVQLVKKRACYIEKVSIANNKVTIAHIERNKDAEWSFPLYWSQVDLRKPNHRWYPHRLLLGSSGRWVEIGQCLTDEERSGLADAIRQAIIMQRHVETMPNA